MYNIEIELRTVASQHGMSLNDLEETLKTIILFRKWQLDEKMIKIAAT
jgi:hypothetical protein